MYRTRRPPRIDTSGADTSRTVASRDTSTRATSTTCAVNTNPAELRPLNRAAHNSERNHQFQWKPKTRNHVNALAVFQATALQCQVDHHTQEHECAEDYQIERQSKQIARAHSAINAIVHGLTRVRDTGAALLDEASMLQVYKDALLVLTDDMVQWTGEALNKTILRSCHHAPNAMEWTSTCLLTALAADGAWSTPALRSAGLPVVRAALRRGACPNRSHAVHAGWPFGIVVAFGRLPLARLMVEEGNVDVNYQAFHKSADTALHLAAVHSDLEMTMWLLSLVPTHGLNPTLRDSHGLSVLDVLGMGDSGGIASTARNEYLANEFLTACEVHWPAYVKRWFSMVSRLLSRPQTSSLFVHDLIQLIAQYSSVTLYSDSAATHSPLSVPLVRIVNASVYR